MSPALTTALENKRKAEIEETAKRIEELGPVSLVRLLSAYKKFGMRRQAVDVLGSRPDVQVVQDVHVAGRPMFILLSG